jgi:Bacterial Ig-like domain (group 3)/FG-GAP-like repeat
MIARRWLFVVSLWAGALEAQTAPTITLSTSPNPSVFGAPVTLTATVLPPSTTGQINFADGTTILGIATLSAGSASISTILLPTGARKITAYYPAALSSDPDVSNTVLQNVASVPGQPQFGQTLNAGNEPTSIVIGDFNKDGIADLAVSNQGDNNLSVFLGLGNGHFQPAVNYATASGPKAVVMSDFDGDGNQDLAVATANGVSVLSGNGDGTFQAAQTYPAGSAGVSALAVGDFGGGGAPDLVAGGFGSSVVMLGNEHGLFVSAIQLAVPSAAGVAIGDFNGDGKPDIALAPLIGEGLFILPGSGHNGNYTFADPFQNGGIYSTIGQAPTALALSDFDGDGVTDAAVVSSPITPGVSILLGNSDGTFQPAVEYPAGQNPYALAVGDFNGDGIADLLVTSVSGPSPPGNVLALRILLGKGNGKFQLAAQLPVADSQAGVALGDFNGDGRIDVAVTNYNSKTISILLGAPVGSCDVTGDGAIGIADLQQIMNEVLGGTPAVHDLNQDGVVNVVDMQIVLSGAIGLGCTPR